MILVSPIEPLQLPCSLTLNPRLKVALTFFRTDPSIKPIDEWQLKRSLLTFLRSSFSLPDDDSDLSIHKLPNLNKRKKDDPVANGVLYMRNLAFLKNNKELEDEEKVLEEWKGRVLDKLEGVDFNIEGVGFVMRVEVPEGEVFETLEGKWEEFFRNSRGGVARQPDTIIIKGIPSRWLAEPRVSSKPSMLVTHTIFSVLGKIRYLNVAEDDDPFNSSDESNEKIVSGLKCKAWIQFENYDNFYNAMKVLCGRSIQKEGSCLKVDYDVTWDKDGFFEKRRSFSKSHLQEKTIQVSGPARHTRNDASRHQSRKGHSFSDVPRAKRFREL